MIVRLAPKRDQLKKGWTLSEASGHVHTLEGVLLVMRNAKGALAAQAHQIEQMKGLFGDEDGTIAQALGDGEDSDDELDAAIAHVRSLIEAQKDASTTESIAADLQDARARGVDVDGQVAQMATLFGPSDDEIVSRGESIDAALDKALQGASARGVAMPTAAALHDRAETIADELKRDLSEVENAEDAEVVLTADAAEQVVDLLMGAALAARLHEDPPEILVNVHGGMVQDILVVEGQPKVLVYVEDNDVEGRDPERDNDLVLLQDEDPAIPDFHADMYTTNGDAFASNGRRWSSLRAEAARLAARGVRADLADDGEHHTGAA